MRCHIRRIDRCIIDIDRRAYVRCVVANCLNEADVGGNGDTSSADLDSNQS
jgi:hypothetical protein